ncbi:acetoacetate decarboxylase [Caballeronia udeis]|uniref:Acetoacetate decarboxylase n=2 Tax=Caballeronia udeis TaxID=1232866 RepID=A0ABW8MVA6_9BURK
MDAALSPLCEGRFVRVMDGFIPAIPICNRANPKARADEPRHHDRRQTEDDGQPAINELVLSITDDLKVVDAWTGEGTVTFPDSAINELSALAPVRNGADFRMGISYTVTDLQLLEDLTQRHAG